MRAARRAALAAALLLAASCAPDADSGGGAILLGAFRVDDVAPRAAGLSGLHVDADGRRMLALDDRSFVYVADIVREGNTPVGLSNVRRLALRQADGRPMYGRDSEGLAVLADDTLAVSYEGINAIFLHRGPKSIGGPLSRPIRLIRLPVNMGIEALASLPDRSLLAIAEARRLGRHPVWRVDPEGHWHPMRGLGRSGGFRPVGADLGPDGRLWLLERAWHLPLRFATRVRTFRVDADGLSDPRTVLRTRTGEWGNFEGISVRAAPGGTVVALVSDDNGHDFMRAHYAEFLVPDPLDSGGEGD